jgi:hypothetical protein
MQAFQIPLPLVKMSPNLQMIVVLLVHNKVDDPKN